MVYFNVGRYVSEADTNEKLPRKRDELKAWSKRKVLEKYNITDINDDVSDAILVGQAYINKFGK